MEETTINREAIVAQAITDREFRDHVKGVLGSFGLLQSEIDEALFCHDYRWKYNIVGISGHHIMILVAKLLSILLRQRRLLQSAASFHHVSLHDFEIWMEAYGEAMEKTPKGSHPSSVDYVYKILSES